MNRPCIFVGSSSAARAQARALIRALADEPVDFLPWWEAFRPGRTLLEELDGLRERVQGALLVFAPESSSTIRGKRQEIPNLNVLFEFGYFYGHFGRSRVAMLSYGEFYLPSDLGGYLHLNGSRSFRRGAALKVSQRTLGECRRWLQGLPAA
jgi:predicted nucleotide-binding protein